MENIQVYNVQRKWNKEDSENVLGKMCRMVFMAAYRNIIVWGAKTELKLSTCFTVSMYFVCNVESSSSISSTKQNRIKAQWCKFCKNNIAKNR